MVAFLSVFLSIVFLLTCLLVVLIVLLQPSHGEGLGSAFGGGISESFFGTHAMTWLARATIALALIFLALAVILNKLPRTSSSGSVVTETGTEAPLPAPAGDTAPPTAPPVTAPPSETPPSSK